MNALASADAMCVVGQAVRLSLSGQRSALKCELGRAMNSAQLRRHELVLCAASRSGSGVDRSVATVALLRSAQRRAGIVAWTMLSLSSAPDRR